MNRVSSRVLALVAILLALSPFAVSTPSKAADKPTHIVSVTLGTDEILFGLLKPEDRLTRIAAITENALDPMQSNISADAKPFKDAKKTLAKADPEVILSFKPDLVFVASYTDAG